MHLTRKESTTQLPLPRKGTKYLARASSHYKSAVPVVIAVRDMLNLAKTAKEVKELIKSKQIKVNSKIVQDYRESIRLFNILNVGGSLFRLSLLETKRFTLESIKSYERIVKIIDRKLISKDTLQLHFHDGTNILTKDSDLLVNDSLILDESNKIKKSIKFKDGGKVIVISGRHQGKEGKISQVTQILLKIDFTNGGSADIAKINAIAY